MNSLIVPIYNEIDAIDEMLERILSFVSKHRNWNVIIVNDGSSDGTKSKIQKKDFKTARIKIIHHKQNKGYGAALKTGIKFSKAKFIAIIDADGTYPFDEFDVLEKHMRDYMMVVGARIKEDSAIPFIKKVPKYFIRKFASYITDTNVLDFNSGMRIFERRLAIKLLDYLPDGFSFTTTITVSSSANNIPIKYIPISYMDRIGKSKIRPIKDTINFFSLIFKLGVYYRPFKIYGPFIFLSGLVGCGFLVYRSFHGEGFLVITIIFFLLSILLMCFAMIAQSISALFRDKFSEFKD